jgi:hypothetical protein
VETVRIHFITKSFVNINRIRIGVIIVVIVVIVEFEDGNVLIYAQGEIAEQDRIKEENALKIQKQKAVEKALAMPLKKPRGRYAKRTFLRQQQLLEQHRQMIIQQQQTIEMLQKQQITPQSPQTKSTPTQTSTTTQTQQAQSHQTKSTPTQTPTSTQTKSTLSQTQPIDSSRAISEQKNTLVLKPESSNQDDDDDDLILIEVRNKDQKVASISDGTMTSVKTTLTKEVVNSSQSSDQKNTHCAVDPSPKDESSVAQETKVSSPQSKFFSC